MIIFPLLKSTKAWMCISYLSKNMKGDFGKFFYIQVRDSLNFFMFKEGSLNFLMFKEGNHQILNSRW